MSNKDKCTYCREYGNLPCEECDKKEKLKSKAMSIKYIKVDINERLPKEDKKYFVWTDNPNARHRENKAEYNMHLAFFDKTDIEFKSFYDVTDFLEEVPDREPELIDMLEEMMHAFDYSSSSYLNNTTDELNMLDKAKTLIQSVKSER